MKHLLARLAIVALAVLVAAYIVPGITVSGGRGFVTVVGMAIVLSLLNALVKPIITLLALPLIALTLGLILLVINAALFALASWIVPHFGVDGFFAALSGSIIVSVVTWLMSYVVPEAKRD